MFERLFASPDISAEEHPDGSVSISSRQPLDPHPSSVLHSFHEGCVRHPDRILVAERAGQAWSTCTWGQAHERVERIAQGLLDRGAAGQPVLILSHNSIDHLLLTLAGYMIGSPVVPTSVAYSLQSTDHAKLRHIVDVCDPAVVFAADDSYGAALQAIGGGRVLLSTEPGVRGVTPITGIERNPTVTLEDSLASIDTGTVAKVVFTSGSTDMPKGVINTHGMLSANQQQMRQVWPFLIAEPPVLLDWLPWSHTFGGNHNVNMVLVNGGSLWIDAGRPTAGLIKHTVDNLADIQPSIYFNVPAGFAALVPILERDSEAAQRFFSRLRIAFFAAAALPQQLWERLEALAAQYGSQARLTTSWGMTETAPAATTTHFPVTRSDSIGVPLPGIELKLVPHGDRHELRLRGPNVTPGYYRRPDLTAIFDAEGFLRTGDVATPVDPRDPAKGLLFEGRIAENFKLSTGTFVTVGTLRPQLLSACAGLVQDAVICGHDGDFVSALVWLHPDHARRLGPDAEPDDDLRDELADGLARLAQTGGGSSQRIERLLIMTTPPDLDAGEITDKGYVNQRMVRQLRADLVEELTRDVASARTICRSAAPAVARR
ncbi:MAG TPA: feruloyl-CoA synthase [Mycobacterium sp.]|nr:feruloyl-CoA synthase [Mycobacterium sp.]